MYKTVAKPMIDEKQKELLFLSQTSFYVVLFSQQWYCFSATLGTFGSRHMERLQLSRSLSSDLALVSSLLSSPPVIHFLGENISAGLMKMEAATPENGPLLFDQFLNITRGDDVGEKDYFH